MHWKKHDGEKMRGFDIKEMDGERIIIIEGDDDIKKLSAEDIYFFGKEDKPRFGVMIKDHDEGVQVSEVIEGSIAETAGVQAGDIIMNVNGIEVNGSSELIDLIKSLEEGKKATFSVLRDGKKKNIEAEM